mmetsp:Transcript_10151/g.21801  ORF Transcript_10151/g.21801 Transcript_10151/m.21801 type:complete len:118 (+) Transcript_10151:97-450(+)
MFCKILYKQYGQQKWNHQHMNTEVAFVVSLFSTALAVTTTTNQTRISKNSLSVVNVLFHRCGNGRRYPLSTRDLAAILTNIVGTTLKTGLSFSHLLQVSFSSSNFTKDDSSRVICGI